LSQAGTFLAWVLFIIALRTPNTTLTNVDAPILGIFILTIPLLVLFIARALDGITGSNVSGANAYLADVTTDKRQKKKLWKDGSIRKFRVQFVC